MKYLIFRNDRIGDFLITAPLIKCIKRENPHAHISIVASEKNYDFIKKIDFVDKIFILNTKKKFDRIKILLKLKKYNFDTIIVSDKKKRSIFLTLLLKSKNKIFNVSKKHHYNLLKMIGKKVLLDNDNQVSNTVKDLIEANCNSINHKLNETDFQYLKKDKFEEYLLQKEFFDNNKKKFTLFHYDEKWEIDSYTKSFSRASTFTDINVIEHQFLDLLSNISNKIPADIIITTGIINTNIISSLKKKFIKINESLYEKNLNGKKVYLMINQNFFEISYLISKSLVFISCHGAFTHIASNFKIKIIDIIEKEKMIHYGRITNHMKNYDYVYRENFSLVSKNIISKL
jgi:hypothetical protein